MKQSEIVVGGTYWTKIGEGRARVTVLGTAVRNGRTRFLVAREGTLTPLPKARAGTALHETRGPW